MLMFFSQFDYMVPFWIRRITSPKTMHNAMHQYTLDLASPAYSVHALFTACVGHKAFALCLVRLIIKSIWVIYRKEHVMSDVPLSNVPRLKPPFTPRVYIQVPTESLHFPTSTNDYNELFGFNQRSPTRFETPPWMTINCLQELLANVNKTSGMTNRRPGTTTNSQETSQLSHL